MFLRSLPMTYVEKKTKRNLNQRSWERWYDRALKIDTCEGFITLRAFFGRLIKATITPKIERYLYQRGCERKEEMNE